MTKYTYIVATKNGENTARVRSRHTDRGKAIRALKDQFCRTYKVVEGSVPVKVGDIVTISEIDGKRYAEFLRAKATL